MNKLMTTAEFDKGLMKLADKINAKLQKKLDAEPNLAKAGGKIGRTLKIKKPSKKE